MKIYVSGNCQAVSLAACLTLMNPGARIERLAPSDRPDALSDDIFFRQNDGRTTDASDCRPANEFVYPRILFSGFHPDVVRIADPDGPARLPMGGRHSSIVLYAWSRGMSAEATAQLFTEPVFEKLGYFDRWAPAKRMVLDEGRSIGFPLEEMFAAWERRGRFMHSLNHPVLSVMADVARELMKRAGLRPAVELPEEYLVDPALTQAIWPLYPEIGRRLGVQGAYAFKAAHAPGQMPVVMDLDEFIRSSFAAYAHAPAGALFNARLETVPYRDLENVAAAGRSARQRELAAPPSNAVERTRTGSPYSGLAPSRFWRRAVEKVAVRDVDPVGDAPFTIDRTTRIATLGSCFAQHISRELRRAGYDYFVAEPPPPELSPGDAQRAQFGVFSTRSGNIYTARQLLQLFDRAYGAFTPDEPVWQRPDGRLADPFRAQIEPAGFRSEDDLLASRERHFTAVRTMFEQLDVLIFTLGLTEAWRSSVDGAVFSMAPGIVAGDVDPERHEFVNFTAAEVRDDVNALLARLKRVNPTAKTVLTVSPVPLIATYEPRHVLASTTYSKGALRAAASEVERADSSVWYFASYEVIAGSFNRAAYYEPDLRTVTAAGVAHVMRLFFAHAAREEAPPPEIDALLLEENRSLMDVVCDEVLFDDERGGHGLPSPEPMDALAPSAMRAPLRATLPAGMAPRTVAIVPCTVSNAADVDLVTAGEFPVYACYRWFDEAGDLAESGNSIHTPLPRRIGPGESMGVTMRVAAPRYPGRYRLRAALLQSNVAWFDDVEPSNGVEGLVVVA